MNDIEIRYATAADAGCLAELRWRCRIEDEKPSPSCDREAFLEACESFFAREMPEGRQMNWIAWDGDEPVACVTVNRVPLVPRPCRVQDAFGVVTNAYTLPIHRNRGIGRRLLECAAAWAREEDLELLIVWPSERAVPLYQRTGFVDAHDILQLQLRPYES